MKHLFHLVERVARTTASVLVRGETGTGKELVARAIHDLSPSASGTLRAINCAALPATLLESDLFGHVRGAFTSAVRDNPGHFEAASGGTQFLDEIREMPPELQANLLRVVQTRTVIPVGGRDSVPVDVRLVAATHRSLRDEVAAGRFRADLMYRLRVVPLYLPPLRQRRGDIELIARKIIDEMNARGGRTVDRIAPDALRALDEAAWPGNLRELENALEYAYAVGDGPVLVQADLPPELVDPSLSIAGAQERVNALAPDSRNRRGSAARSSDPGNRDRAPRILAISRSTLWRRMRELGLLDAAA